jgi:hypothetical protein
MTTEQIIHPKTVLVMLEQAQAQVAELKAQVAELTADRDKWYNLTLSHNEHRKWLLEMHRRTDTKLRIAIAQRDRAQGVPFEETEDEDEW